MATLEKEGHPVQRMNKKAMKLAIIGGAGLCTLIAVLSLDSKKSRTEAHSVEQQAFATPALPKAVAALPSSFGQAKQVEAELAPPPQAIAQEMPAQPPPPTYRRSHQASASGESSAWQEARAQERERQADEHWQARRSGLFFDEGKASAKLAAAEAPADNIGRHIPAKGNSIMQGTIIPAVLLTNLNTDVPGPLLAQVSDNVFDSKTGKKLLIPQGSKLVGEYNAAVSFGQQRAQVFWTRIIFPDTSSMNLGRMTGVDRQGASGHQGEVDQHLGQAFVGAVLSTLLSTGASLANKPGPQSSFGQELGNAAANTVNRAADKIASKSLDIPPTIVVKSGTQINVFVNQDMEIHHAQNTNP